MRYLIVLLLLLLPYTASAIDLTACGTISDSGSYLLQNNVSSNGTCFVISASNVTLDLNGKTITYNQTTAGDGITTGDWNKTDITITNGYIIQGAAMSEGDQYGVGNNPINIQHPVTRLTVSNINATYGGRDVAGLKLKGEYHFITGNTLTDTYEFGTLKNRHQGIDAIDCQADHSTISNNTIVNTRHRGIWPRSYSQVYGNTIGIRSLATNSYGIMIYGVHDTRAYNNNITGRGEAPIAIVAHGGAYNIEVDHNTIDVQVTRLGLEYGGNPDDCKNPASPCLNADYASGLRSTSTAGNTNIRFHHNIITGHSNASYEGKYSPTGETIYINSGTKGIFAGGMQASDIIKFDNNTITVIDNDGTGDARGISCSSDTAIDNVDSSAGVSFEYNSITSNVYGVMFGDSYGGCKGNPLFIGNTITKSATNNTNFKTYGTGLFGYYEGTARLIDNILAGGATNNIASSAINYDACGSVGNTTKNKDFIIGHLQVDNYLYYDYKLSNSNGTTCSATPVNTTLNTLGAYYTAPDSGGTTLPVTTTSKPSGNYKATQTVTLTTTGTSIKYCLTTGTSCTPTTTYSAAFKVLKNAAKQTYCVQSTDGTNNEAIKCYTLTKKKKTRR